MRARIGAAWPGGGPCHGLGAGARQTGSRSSPRTCAFPKVRCGPTGRSCSSSMADIQSCASADGGLTNVWERPGCGPAALAQAGADLLVTCYDENTLVLVSTAGKTLRVYDKDDAGASFIGPNDFVADRGAVCSCPHPAPGRPPRSSPRSSIAPPTAACGQSPTTSLRQRPRALSRRQDALLLRDLRLSDRRIRRRREWQPRNRREFARVNDIAGGGPPWRPTG